MLWEEIRSGEFKKAIENAAGVCAVPIGCMEAHGNHLPVGTDAIEAAAIAKRAAEKESVCVFPTIYFGEKSGAGEFPGTIILSHALLFQLLGEICDEIGRNGFKKIIIVNGHGGNMYMLKNFVRGVLQKRKPYLVFSCDLSIPFPKTFLKYYARKGKKEFPDLTDADLEILQNFVENKYEDGHAGMAETAWIYDICPQWVELGEIDGEKGKSMHQFDALSAAGIYSPFAWMADYPNSYACNADFTMTPTLAAAMTKYSVDALAEKFRLLKTEKISEEYHAQWIEKNQ